MTHELCRHLNATAFRLSGIRTVKRSHRHIHELAVLKVLKVSADPCSLIRDEEDVHITKPQLLEIVISSLSLSLSFWQFPLRLPPKSKPRQRCDETPVSFLLTGTATHTWMQLAVFCSYLSWSLWWCKLSRFDLSIFISLVRILWQEDDTQANPAS